MAQLIKPPMRLTNEEWICSNNRKYRNAEIERAAAERLQNEADRMIDETGKRTKNTLADVNKKIDQTIDDTKYWKGELDKKHNDLENETLDLEVYIQRLEKALEGVSEPLHITNTCLLNREGRKGADLVHDNVQKELIKESEVHKGVQNLLQKTIAQANEQRRLNRKAIFKVACDIRDKFTAQSIDEHCANLRPNSKEIGYIDGDMEMNPKSAKHEDWVNFSNDNVQYGERERQNSKNMRSIIDGILQQVYNDQIKQKENVDIALKDRILETKDSKGKLEEHMKHVLKEISNMNDTIREVQVAIEGKKETLQLAETRIDVRNTRPNIENRIDPAQYKLFEEIGEIKTDMSMLGRQLADCHTAMKGLNRRQLDLEEEIQVKSNSIFIDEVQCQGIRESINIKSW